MTVRRVDGTMEFDAETDAYSILCEQARAALKSLGKLAGKRMQSRDVFGLLVTIKDKGALGVELTPTVVVPVDPELAGALAFGGLMALREHDPKAFAVAIRRLTDAGILRTPSRA